MSFGLIIQILYLFLLSLVMASLEVQIEGKAGWASQLPTWRPKAEGYFSKIYRLFLFGKDVTGYHLLIFTLLLTVLHYPYFAGKSWDMGQEFVALSLFFLLSVVWDFLWFVLNPSYGLGNFKQKNIWWHKKWFLLMPVDYLAGLAFSLLLYLRFSLDFNLFKEWLFVVSLFFVLILAVISLGVFLKRIKI